MSFMSRILGLVGLPESAWIEGVYLALRMRMGQRPSTLADRNPKRPWFSMVEEKQFRSERLERRAHVESAIRMTVAR